MGGFRITWEVKKLGDVCEISTGKWDANHAIENGQYCFFTCAKEPMSSNTKRFSGECLVLPGNGVNVGDVYYYSGDFDAYQRTYVISKIKLFPKYLFYHMLTFWKERNLNKQYGSATNFLKIGNFNEYKISHGPLPEQKRIVAILDEAFENIARAKESAEKNLKNANEIFESYLQSVFENKGKGWEEKTLGDVCNISSKLIDPREETYIDLYHVGGANIESMTGCLLDLKTSREEKLISGKFAFNNSTVLYSKIRPYLIKVVRPDFSGICSADIYPLSPVDSILDRDFLYFLLLTKDFTNFAIKGSARVGMPKVNRKHLFSYPTFFPTLFEQQSIVAKLDALSAETKKLEAIYTQKLADLEELKKSILQKAFKGELTDVST